MYFKPRRFVLKNGVEILIRPLKYTDKKELINFYSELSDKSRIQLFQDCRTLEAWRTMRIKKAELYTDGLIVDFKKSYSLLAWTVDEKKFKLIGDGRFFLDKNNKKAELYLVVHENYRNIGVGSALLEMILECLKQLKVEEVYCYISKNNESMLKLIEKYGFNREDHEEVYLFWKRL
ncbi:MAG: GNAT family N-acetyltransferase [Candidatus Odinarchaeum yellowstonii]|uniref:GNAT family N-acetyltransferase n=1 Tax=Odinarchaeota yellowstonii (strain LCB_4) TaxID=1841599 RepID=A0AAF0D2Y5_ODILC|nr:MAG: GNAT family N-acetyltransferase [Candidatus Odinarchaeum yellowstonii]